METDVDIENDALDVCDKYMRLLEQKVWEYAERQAYFDYISESQKKVVIKLEHIEKALGKLAKIDWRV